LSCILASQRVSVDDQLPRSSEPRRRALPLPELDIEATVSRMALADLDDPAAPVVHTPIIPPPRGSRKQTREQAARPAWPG
jgi:hypothetical protein